MTTPQENNAVPVGKTEILIAIAWDRASCEYAGVNYQGLLRDNQIAFDILKMNGSSPSKVSTSDLSVTDKSGNQVIFVKVSNATEGDQYGVRMQKHRKLREEIRFSVGVFA